MWSADQVWTDSVGSPATPASPLAAKWIDKKHLEGLRTNLSAASRELNEYLASDLGERERSELIGRVALLETDVRAVQREAEHWRACYLQSQHDCAVAADVFEEKADIELRDAHKREKQLWAKHLEASLHRAKAEDVATRSEAEARRHLNDLKLQQGVLRKVEERAGHLEMRVSSLEGELTAAAVRHAEQLRSAESEHADALRVARVTAEERCAVPEAKAARLECALNTASPRQAEELKHELQVERAGRFEQLRAAEQHAGVLASRVARLEDELAKERMAAESSTAAAVAARESERLALERMDEHALSLRNSERRVRLVEARSAGLEKDVAELSGKPQLLQGRIAGLEKELAEASAKQAEIIEEAQIFRSKADHLEQVNQKLRSDMQEAQAKLRLFNIDGDVALQLPAPLHAPVRPSTAGRKVRPPLSTQEHQRLPRTLQLRSQVMSARGGVSEDLCSLASGETKGQTAQGGALADRTAAVDRYNEEGRLESFDALGRRVP